MKLSLIVDLGIFLRAKIAPVCLWEATQTTPNLPSPNFLPKMKSCKDSSCLIIGFTIGLEASLIDTWDKSFKSLPAVERFDVLFIGDFDSYRAVTFSSSKFEPFFLNCMGTKDLISL